MRDPTLTELRSDLQVAQEIERRILEAQIWDKVGPIVRAAVAPFEGKPLTEDTIHTAQQVLQKTLDALGPDFLPVPGIRLVLKRHPEDPFSLVLELEDE